MKENLFTAFISHSSQDADQASEACRLLEARGLTCWIAPRNIVGGREYADELVRGIAGSASMLVLISSHSNLSKHVLREVEQAVKLGKPVFPIVLEKVKLSRALDYYIAPIHWIEATRGFQDETANAIAQAIQGNPNWTTSAVGPSLMRKIRYRRDAFLMALGGGLVVVAGVSIVAFASWTAWARARDTESDKNYLSLGWVTLKADAKLVESGQDRSSDVQAIIFWPIRLFGLPTSGSGSRESNWRGKRLEHLPLSPRPAAPEAQTFALDNLDRR